MKSKPKMLILVFSELSRDPRVLKQVKTFADDYQVTTLSYGQSEINGVEHIAIPRLPDLYKYLSYILVDLHLYWIYYWLLPLNRHVKKLLRGTQWDIVIANDTLTVPLAVSLKPQRGVIADLHEFFPRYHEDDQQWMKRIAPYHVWICHRYVSRAKLVTTVSQSIADEYARLFKFQPQVITNATPYADLKPSAFISGKIRLVHSGSASPGRSLETLIEAMKLAQKPELSLDMYLVVAADEERYFQDLVSQAADVSGVTVNRGVSYNELIPTLNTFDVGVHLLPPTTFNNIHALPNKLFDYVQARLGIVCGPSPEMVRYVEQYHLGEISKSFDSDSLADILSTLSAESVQRWKQNSESAAKELSAEHELKKLSSMVQKLLKN